VGKSGSHITLAKLAEMTGGTVEGNADVLISGVCSLDHPRADHIALAVNPSTIRHEAGAENAAAYIVARPVQIPGASLLVHENPRLAFTIALRHFYPEEKTIGGIDPNAQVARDADVRPSAHIGPFAVVESKAKIGERAEIGAGCYIGAGSVIGDETQLYANVTVLHDVAIGKRCIIHSGAVIGSDGFGFTPTESGNIKVPQTGRVEIGDDVEIGAGTTIDRATLDATRIGDDVKIDNLVQIAHNVQIGPHTRIAAQAGLSGRVIIEGNVVVGGQAGFQNGITVGEGSVIAGRAGVTRHVPPHSRVSGYPARDHKKALALLAAQNRLPEILERLESIERMLEKTVESS
jgi:UDP-3-O-[3-hydroxymyristoyl] glucosamine N-acyltransferase